jgi:hypothetical protein
MILAKNTRTASGHHPATINDCTPLKIVSGSPFPNEMTVITGYTLAGIYKIYAATTSAHVRARLLGFL